MNFSEIEEKILQFWGKNRIFEKSVKQAQKRKYFSFYDGPPFATGSPHYGHILATTIKDTVTRFWYMSGYKIERRVGWDCHGLPIENLIEKETGIKGGKKEILEQVGIGKFNQACASAVLRCVDDFEKTLQRVGRWADYANSYATMDKEYTESVWWVFNQLYQQGLIYEDFRVTPYCPRCGTPLSNFEVNQGYQDIEDESVYVKFPVLGEQNTYFLVWTTTPWTLPANAALAIGEKVKYQKLKNKETGEALILAKERSGILDKEKFTILEEIGGQEMVSKKYQPLFKNPDAVDAYRVVAANFVSTDEGTGLVHIAPAFGEDDMALGRKEKLPTLITVDQEGRIIKGLNLPGEGKFVKEADEDIKADLKKRGLLLKEEKIVHSYPFCWRCDTPLLYFPITSWYVAVTKFKKELVTNNQKILWVPGHLKEGRFGKWLRGARDWSISRNRFWGAPIPIWKCEQCEKTKSVGSIEELKQNSVQSGNRYFLMRHGQAENNTGHFLNGDIKTNHLALTEFGRKQVAQTLARKFKKQKIDLIFSSDFLRTKQTAEAAAEKLGLDKNKIIFDVRLREIDGGVLNGQSNEKFREFGTLEEKFTKAPEGGETLNQVKSRVSEFLYETDKKYQEKNILIVGHEFPLWLLSAGAQALNEAGSIALRKDKKYFLENAQVLELNFSPLPHNQNFELDLHRPFIDEIELRCSCGGKMQRIEEVFDCWFESGSMPYAQWHYPFANKKLVEQTFPADFIAEGMDQTRGWFYTLHVLASALTLKKGKLGFNQPAFKNCIANGLILGEDGKKLSKRLRNYPEVNLVFEKYGADSLRYFLLSSTPIGEDYIVSERRIADTMRRTLMTLQNSFSFFSMYVGQNFKVKKVAVKNILDKWILSRLNSLNSEVIKEMKAYELTRAARLFDGFIDDLSNWYIRRSRERFQRPQNQKEKEQAAQTLYFVLLNLAKLMAPFTPFISEEIYQQLKNKKDRESVHLCDYPKPSKKAIDKKLEEKMGQAREIVAQALAERAAKGIKVRQPLAFLTVKERLNQEFLDLIAQEVNVKKVKVGRVFKLDTEITEELKREGAKRELERYHAALRKEMGLMPADKTFAVSSSDVSLISSDTPEDWRTEKIEKFDLKQKYDGTKEIKTDLGIIKIGIKK